MSMFSTITDMLVLQAAQTCHEANRAFSAINGDDSQMPWSETPDNIKASAIDGVKKVFSAEFNSPEDGWKSWKAFKIADGWVYGEVKDIEAKTHPNLVDYYSELPITEQAKDLLFMSVALSFLDK